MVITTATVSMANTTAMVNVMVTAMDMVRPKVKEKTSNFEINMKKTLKKDDLFCIFIAYKPSIKIQ